MNCNGQIRFGERVKDAAQTSRVASDLVEQADE
jgi:hypothetical protein